MQTISRDRIQEELAVLGVLYPAAMIGPTEIVLLLDAWEADLGHLTEQQFLDAVAEYRRNNKFFPCTADILEAHDIVSAKEPVKPKLVALPQVERPANHASVNKVVQLANTIRRRNPNMSFCEASRRARKGIA